MAEFVCYFDGACEPRNPGGHIGMGGFIFNDKEEVVFETSRYRAPSPSNTNNVAEYGALWYLLDWLDRNNLHTSAIHVKGDSMLVVNQMSGVWRIKEGAYAKGARICKNLVDKFTCIKFEHVYRSHNEQADLLSKRCLEERGIFSAERKKK